MVKRRPKPKPEPDVIPEPINISIIGTQSSEGGGVAPTKHGTIARTPAGEPNLRINVITPALAILVRAVNVFLNTFISMLTAAGVGEVTGINKALFNAPDFGSLVLGFAWLSLIAAGVATAKNIYTVSFRLEGKFPLLTGSI